MFHSTHSTSANFFYSNTKSSTNLDGLDYRQARYYDSEIGLFLSVDPLGDFAPNWTPYRFGFNNPIRYIDPDGQWEKDANGNLVANKGDNASTLAKFANISLETAISFLAWSGLVPNEMGTFNSLFGGEKFFDPNHLFALGILQKNSSGISIPFINPDLTIKSTSEAWDHYMTGNGASRPVDHKTVDALLGSNEFQLKFLRVISGATSDLFEGNFGVNLTFSYFHVGRTNVEYATICKGNQCRVTFKLFANDGFYDVDFIDENTFGRIGIKMFQPDGLGPNLERFGGTPYLYQEYIGTYDFINPKP